MSLLSPIARGARKEFGEREQCAHLLDPERLVIVAFRSLNDLKRDQAATTS
jgi:hypothetical protein